MSASAIVPASYVRLSTLADGTVRVVLDVEPKNLAAAFSLFDAPGVPVAVARLTNEAAVAHDHRQHAETPRGAAAGQDGEAALAPSVASPSDPLPKQKAPMPLAGRVAMTCGERSFVLFLRCRDEDRWNHIDAADDRQRAAEFVRRECDVASRGDIKPGTRAAAKWQTLHADYEHWQRTGAAA